MVSPARLCIICKGGRNLCGNKTCPLLPRIRAAPDIQKRVISDAFSKKHARVAAATVETSDILVNNVTHGNRNKTIDSIDELYANAIRNGSVDRVKGESARLDARSKVDYSVAQQDLDLIEVMLKDGQISVQLAEQEARKVEASIA